MIWVNAQKPCLILGKFIKHKIDGYKLKSESIAILYDALLQSEDIDLSLDSERVARVQGWATENYSRSKAI